jgi:hypothetical protein
VPLEPLTECKLNTDFGGNMPTTLTPAQATLKAQRQNPDYKKTHDSHRRMAEQQADYAQQHIKKDTPPELSAGDWTEAALARAGQVTSRGFTDTAAGLLDVLGRKETAKRITDFQNRLDDKLYGYMNHDLADIYKDDKVSQSTGTIGSNAIGAALGAGTAGGLLRGVGALGKAKGIAQLAAKAKPIYAGLKGSKLGRLTSTASKNIWNQVPKWKRWAINKSLKLGKGALNVAKTKAGSGTIATTLGTALNVRGNAPEYRLSENDLLHGTDIAGRKNFLQKAQDRANEIFRDNRVRHGNRETYKDYVAYRDWYDMFHNPDKLYKYNPVDVELNPGRPIYYSKGYGYARESKPMQVANPYVLKRMQERHGIESDYYTSLEHGPFHSSWLGKVTGADRANLADGAVFDKDSNNHAIYISPRYNSHAKDKSYSSYYYLRYNSKFKDELERLNYANLKGKAKQDAYNQAAENAHSYATSWWTPFGEVFGKGLNLGRSIFFPIADDVVQTAYAAGNRDLLPASSNIASAGTQLISDALLTKTPSLKALALKNLIFDFGVPTAAEILRQEKTWGVNHPVGQNYETNYYDKDNPYLDEFTQSGARPPVYAER